MSILNFIEKKKSGVPLALVTAYDYTSACWTIEAGVDAILIGDSLGNVIQGQDTTLGVTIDEMIYHCKLVHRAAEKKRPDPQKRPVVIADLPFPVGRTGCNDAVRDAARIVKESGCTAVKFEGGKEDAPIIQALVKAGIPVMGHIGLRPQQILNLGKYSLQKQEEVLLEDAFVVANAGAFAVVLECVKADIAKKVSEQINIPTIGIGSGPYCDGQILVLNDLLGFDPDFVPRHAKQYAHVGETAIQALSEYCREVSERKFPQ